MARRKRAALADDEPTTSGQAVRRISKNFSQYACIESVEQPISDAFDLMSLQQPASSKGRRGPQHRSDLVSSFFQPHAPASRGTLADLDLHLAEDTIHQPSRSAPPASPALAQARAELLEQHVRGMDAWFASLHAGASVLLYGWGSKAPLLQTFGARWALDGACVAVQGLHPGLTSRAVLVWVAAAAKAGPPSSYKSYREDALLELIESEAGNRRVYVLLHNIDGPGLRDNAAQRALAAMAALPNVHLVATVDHVNAPLLWDAKMQSQFSWVWHATPTFIPYDKELVLAGVPSLLLGRREEGSKAGALLVLSSLSQSARAVFQLLANQQLEVGGEHGISFDKLFQMCREQFLVSNEMLLKGFLAEFRDHGLVVTRRHPDGGDVLAAPLAPKALARLLTDVAGL
ncbi:subunit 2 of origin recognition complex ORC2 [Helicosporidium sp. ATCC 50920]|nr:subunit 2 of origin recognition complex ORC2 [Helicosporidium sp. ATCC 50920]|eukprot:KDD75193.1 subunit 2 of origin recognition complex ORC2 [Helicosporidium sp. ATCC 50920]